MLSSSLLASCQNGKKSRLFGVVVFSACGYSEVSKGCSLPGRAHLWSVIWGRCLIQLQVLVTYALVVLLQDVVQRLVVRT